MVTFGVCKRAICNVVGWVKVWGGGGLHYDLLQLSDEAEWFATVLCPDLAMPASFHRKTVEMFMCESGWRGGGRWGGREEEQSS